MDLQQMQAAVDGVDEANLAGQLMHQTDAADADGANLVGEFHADAGGCEHRLTLIFPRAVQPPLDPLLGFPQTILYTGLHSKSSLFSGERILFTPPIRRKTRMVSSFL